MNKKLIRLTESDLHRIVKESVNQVLTELDWKTYMNAARARQAQGKYDNATQLSNYANNQFKKSILVMMANIGKMVKIKGVEYMLMLILMVDI